MPRRADIETILIVGAGPIVIGQACEFDYSGAQACKALRQEGYRVVLVNSNPATIMTDPDTADATYIEPITPELTARVIAREKPDALLATMGGQTALNTAFALAESGVLAERGVELIGASREAIARAENRDRFQAAMAQVELYVDPRKAAETADRIPLGSERFETAEAVKTIARLFSCLGDPDDLDDAPVRPAYIDAIRLLRDGMEAAAVEGFIEVIRRDRYYDTDGARKAVIAVFKLLGDDHETTKTYRNPFADALY